MANHRDGVLKHLTDEQEILNSALFSAPSAWYLKKAFGKSDAPEKEKVAALRKQVAWCLELSVRDILDRYTVSKGEDETLSLIEESREKLQADLRTPNVLTQFQSILFYGDLLEKIDLLAETQLKYANAIPNKYILRMSGMVQLSKDISKRLHEEQFSSANPNFEVWEKILKLIVFGTVFISSVLYLCQWLGFVRA